MAFDYESLLKRADGSQGKYNSSHSRVFQNCYVYLTSKDVSVTIAFRYDNLISVILGLVSTLQMHLKRNMVLIHPLKEVKMGSEILFGTQCLRRVKVSAYGESSIK